ncbi:alpha/beta hydrolase [Methyloceanibacter sp.]|uniref:RBBP9/YdeN family alpha/beta hydrolase n=1 Tax=Methyloceanibacter sp. TaxID=1965321 RepID=UPI002CFE16F7|nr:alpha/beta hydrolase [Methyloceanibacter sp.]HML91067.1 alpha/beta hydrolase [Methyloceanibacter sp.]
MAKRLLIPGLGGSEQGHWQQWWLTRDPNASLVEQDDWANPDAATWVGRLASVVSKNPGSILVGHSLGGTLIPLLAQAHPDLNIRGALIVAPADADESPALREIAPGFAPIPGARLPFPSIAVASANDPYLRIERAMNLARAWGAQFVHAGESGHINTSSGYGPWPAGLRLATQLIKNSPPVAGFHRLPQSRPNSPLHPLPVETDVTARVAQ